MWSCGGNGPAWVMRVSAGMFELNRTGDDTSGKAWKRIPQMGVNTLAFRGPQHGAFYAVDADCCPITKQLPWEKSRRWLDLVARSGTPLFVSVDRSALTDAMGGRVASIACRGIEGRAVGRAAGLDGIKHAHAVEFARPDRHVRLVLTRVR